MLNEAMLYEPSSDLKVICQLCAHRCVIHDGKTGLCRVRENRDGTLYTLTYGNLIAQHVDPIEKKPLYHFLPGSSSFSIATPGCNFRCGWCQNWQISQAPREMQLPIGRAIPPQTIVDQAISNDCQSIAYTYTEPTIFFEYAYDVFRLAAAAGLKNIFVTNGFMTPEMLDLASPYLDAANVDIKAFKDETYRTLMGGRLEPVLESCRRMKALGVWLEITTLIVPGVNDDPEELQSLADFISRDLGSETPWHISRFYPQYKMTEPAPTPLSSLNEARQMGETAGLKYIYVDNASTINETHCKNCDFLLIKRSGFSVDCVGLNDQFECTNCGTRLDGVFN